ncbi:MAG: hypothetical protein ACREC5_04735, partial [Thermoplasmata archaeon]
GVGRPPPDTHRRLGTEGAPAPVAAEEAAPPRALRPPRPRMAIAPRRGPIGPDGPGSRGAA